MGPHREASRLRSTSHHRSSKSLHRQRFDRNAAPSLRSSSSHSHHSSDDAFSSTSPSSPLVGQRFQRYRASHSLQSDAFASVDIPQTLSEVPKSQRSIPWRDMTSVVAVKGVGLAVIAGRTGTATSAKGPFYSIGHAPFASAELASNPQDIWLLQSANGQFARPKVSGTTISRFGHACVYYSPKDAVVCTGGFLENGDTKKLVLQIGRRNGTTIAVEAFGIPENGPEMDGSGRGLHASAVVGNKVYLFVLSYVYGTNEDSDLGTFSGSCAVALPSGKVLLAGGATTDEGAPAPLASFLWLFDPEKRSFAAVNNTIGNGPTPRWGSSCTYADGMVYVHGGCDPNGKGPTDPAIYKLNVTQAPWSWTKADSGNKGPGPRCFGSASIYKGYAVFIGGQSAGAPISTTTGKQTANPNPTQVPNSDTKTNSSQDPKTKAPGPSPSPDPNDPDDPEDPQPQPPQTQSPRDSYQAPPPKNPKGFIGERVHAFAASRHRSDKFKNLRAGKHHKKLEDQSFGDSIFLGRRADEADPGFYIFNKDSNDWIAPNYLISLDQPPSKEPIIDPTPKPSPSPSPSPAPLPKNSPPNPTSDPSSSPSTSNSSDSGAKNPLTDPIILSSIIVGGVIFIAIIAAVLWYFFRYRKDDYSRRSRLIGQPGSRMMGNPANAAGGMTYNYNAVGRTNSLFGNSMSRNASNGFRRMPDQPVGIGYQSVGNQNLDDIVIPPPPSADAYIPQPHSVTSPMSPQSDYGELSRNGSLFVPPPPQLERRATGKASVTASGRYFDPERNTFIPLLAPIKDDYVENEDAISQVTNSIAEELGDPSNIPLGPARPGYMGLSLSSTPLRDFSHDDQSGFRNNRYGQLDIPVHLLEGLKFQVIYPYETQASGEVELRWGDVIAVKRFYKDGWAHGLNETLQTHGAFPIFAIEELDEGAARTGYGTPSNFGDSNRSSIGEPLQSYR
ncbi:hypothetical protein HDU97_002663 [Phlyctochytrium planicorne]|nr:hypothetical protein HDU97_002663 [Phlyctochytrium planicorne]